MSVSLSVCVCVCWGSPQRANPRGPVPAGAFIAAGGSVASSVIVSADPEWAGLSTRVPSAEEHSSTLPKETSHYPCTAGVK